MSHRELALSVLRGEEEDIVPFFPDISEWYKIKRLPIERVNEIPPGSFIGYDESLHKDNLVCPKSLLTGPILTSIVISIGVCRYIYMTGITLSMKIANIR